MAAVGGIAGASGNIGGGETSATIEDCYSQGEIFTNKTAYSDGNYLGGIVGNTDGTVRRVYSSGGVTSAAQSSAIYGANAGTVTDAYSSGLTDTVLDGSLNTQGDYSVWTFAADELPALTCFSIPTISLSNAADNASVLETYNGQTVNIILSDRTLYKDGSWNTLCLPFEVSITSSPLSGDNVQAMTLNTSTNKLTDGTLTLNFDAVASTIPAGTPFIIKWDNAGTTLTEADLVFNGPVISNANNNAPIVGVLTFTGTYAPVTIGSEGDNIKLYLGSGNTLYYPSRAMTIGCQRAYFQLADGITAGNTETGGDIKAFVLNFDGTDTVESLTPEPSPVREGSAGAWYSLDGRKLSLKSTHRGIYILNGKKVVIKYY